MMWCKGHPLPKKEDWIIKNNQLYFLSIDRFDYTRELKYIPMEGFIRDMLAFSIDPKHSLTLLFMRLDKPLPSHWKRVVIKYAKSIIDERNKKIKEEKKEYAKELKFVGSLLK